MPSRAPKTPRSRAPAASPVGTVGLDNAGRPDALGRALELAAFQVLNAPGSELDYSEYRDDPVGFIENVLGDELWTFNGEIDPALVPIMSDEETAATLAGWSDQRRIAEDLAAHRFVTVAASKGIGKTFLAARLVIWFLQTRPDSMVITTANTWAQVETQLWAEIRDAWANARLPLRGSPMRTKWEPDSVRHPKWMALGLSPDEDQAIAGFHSKAGRDETRRTPVLVIGDECSTIGDGRMDALRGLLTNEGSKMLWIGNPTRVTGRFAEVWFPPAGIPWDKVPLNERQLRLRDEWEPRRHHINFFMAPAWVRDASWLSLMRSSCGGLGDAATYLRNPLYRCDVLGLFSDTAEDQFYPHALLESAAAIRPRLADGRHMGVDIGGSSDPCVAVLTVDGVVSAIKVWAGQEDSQYGLMRTAYIIRTLAVGDTWEDPESENRGWDVDPRNVHIDATSGSIGVGVLHKLGELGLYVDPVDFGAGGDDVEMPWDRLFEPRPKLRTRRQALAWIGQQALAQGYASIPRTPEFLPIWADLTELRYNHTATEGMKVESNGDFKKRTGRSMDYGAAWLASLSRRAAVGEFVSRLAIGSRRPGDGRRRVRFRGRARTR